MDLKIEFQETPDYLSATVSGNMKFENIKTAILRVGDTAKQSNYKKILLDLRSMATTMTILQRFNTGLMMAQTARKFKIAGIRPQDETNPMVETAAQNRGINMKMFYDEDDAIEWLLTR